LSSDANDLSLDDGSTIDTDTGQVTDGAGSPVLVSSFELAAPTDGVPVRVFVVGALSVEGVVEVQGSEAVAFVADQDITVDGILTIAAKGSTAGPGSIVVGDPCLGANGTIVQMNGSQMSGAGGGGSRESGGAGGSIDFAIVGGAGGQAFPNPDLIPLRGGCRGGGAGGGGGGAIQLVSRTSISLAADAVISAGGGLGEPEPGLSPPGGGGSGGGILLEAPAVMLGSRAALAANGGGGACASGFGENGLLSSDAASGGLCFASNSDHTDGGNGGTGAEAPKPGVTIVFSSAVERKAGSGGGAAGHIRINTADAAFVQASDSLLSPPGASGMLAGR
jgi:hypothetical protein